MLFKVGWVVMADENLDRTSANTLASRSNKMTYLGHSEYAVCEGVKGAVYWL